MTNLTNDPAAMAVIRDAIQKLESLGFDCLAFPNDLPGYGASVSLHIGDSVVATSAAYVANLRGSEFPHLADEGARKGFAREVAEFVVAMKAPDVPSTLGRVLGAAAVGRGPIAELTPVTKPQRAGDGFLIPGQNLKLRISADPAGNGIQVYAALQPADGSERGVALTSADTCTYDPDLVTLNGDVLRCAARSAYATEYLAPGITDFQEGFTVTLEPGQADAVRQAVVGACRVLAAYRGVVAHLEPWLSNVQPSAWYVTKPLYALVVAYVLDDASHDAALAAFDRVANGQPDDARLRIADPAVWEILKNARS